MTGLIEAKLRRAIAERLAAKVATFAKPSTLTADGSGYGGRGTVLSHVGSPDCCPATECCEEDWPEPLSGT